MERLRYKWGTGWVSPSDTLAPKVIVDARIAEVVVACDRCNECTDRDVQEHWACSDEADRLVRDGWVRVSGPYYDDYVLGPGWRSVLVRVEARTLPAQRVRSGEIFPEVGVR